MSALLWLFSIWSKLERWKSSISGYLMSWLKIKKIVVLKFHLLLFYAMRENHFFMMCNEKGFYMTTGDSQLSGWAEKKLQSTSQSQTCTKKRPWSLFGNLLPVWSTTAFWIPAKSLHLRIMLSRLIRCTENYNACSQHGSKEWAPFFSWQHPAACHTTSTSKVEWIGLQHLPHLICSPDLSPTNYWFFNILTPFCKGKHFHNQQHAENAFQVLIKFWGMDFYATGINKLISYWQKCGDCDGSYFVQ